MSMTIDNLRVNHRITVLQDFTDANGITIRAGEAGILRELNLDYTNMMQIHIIIEFVADIVDLVFPLRATTGPRNGHMQDFFEIGEDATPVRTIPAFQQHTEHELVTPPLQNSVESFNTHRWHTIAQSTDGPDRLEQLEEEMLRTINHIGVAASIAEIYATRMRTFQRTGNEARAIAAFKLAMSWMGNYAASATSGGEGAALSYERDQFYKALILEFGYDPTMEKS